jgi:two-component system NtrC family sensor kinase
MKKNLLLLLLFAMSLHGTAQDPAREKIIQELDAHPQQDTFRVNRLNELAFYVNDAKNYNEALDISRKIGYAAGEGYALTQLGFSKRGANFQKEADSLFHRADSIATESGNPDLIATVQVYRAYSIVFVDLKLGLIRMLEAEKKAASTGNKRLLSLCQYLTAVQYANGLSNLPKGLEYYLKSIQTAEEIKYLRFICAGYLAIGNLYNRMDDEATAHLYFEKARETNKQWKSPRVESQLLVNEGRTHREAGRYAKAIETYKRALGPAKNLDSNFIVSVQTSLANTYTKMDSLSLAFKYALSSFRYARKVGDYLLLSEVIIPLSKAYLKNKMPDSAIYYAKLGYDSSKSIGAVEVMRDNAEVLANAYAYKKEFENAYSWHILYTNHRDSVVNTEVRNKSAVAQYNADLEKKQSQITALNQQKKIQQKFLYSALAVLLLIIIIAFILLKSNQQKQKTNKLLQRQKQEIGDQRDQTNKVLEHLQQTQVQLIQSEKMASLGELTAGIAHEIQNPLNFVNNFSEVNIELIDELEHEADKGNIGEIKLIAKDIKENEQKINHHGKRADAIVKGMSQHSRSGTGVKEPSDINALAAEYLRLAYHALKGKGTSFNVTMKTDFDKTIDNINIIPQDIGRMLLNLYNNAFYAVGEKKKSADADYEPTLSVSTKKVYNKIAISVNDNGNGIPQKVVDKIFQPFFTTKPTGQGTGLGLSLSYDIIKAHGGEIKVNTKENEGSEFIIQLPLK